MSDNGNAMNGNSLTQLASLTGKNWRNKYGMWHHIDMENPPYFITVVWNMRVTSACHFVEEINPTLERIIKKKMLAKWQAAPGSHDEDEYDNVFDDDNMQIADSSEEADEDEDDQEFEPGNIVGKVLALVSQVCHHYKVIIIGCSLTNACFVRFVSWAMHAGSSTHITSVRPVCLTMS
jgi:hypothetical protein